MAAKQDRLSLYGVPPQVRDWWQRRADKNRRSLSAEIVGHLERVVEQDTPPPAGDAGEQTEEDSE